MAKQPAPLTAEIPLPLSTVAATPLIQLEQQKDALFPFPLETTIDAWKRSESTLSQGSLSY